MEDGPKPRTEETYDDRRLLEGLSDSVRVIYRLVLTLLALGLFTLIALGLPDAFMLNPAVTVAVPSIGATTAKAMLIVVPLLLVSARIYLHVYVDHWRRLNTKALAQDIRLAAGVSPMTHPLLRPIIDAALYLLVPAAMIAFTWKAMVLPHSWGVALLLGTLLVVAGHLMQLCSGIWGIRSALAGLFLLGVFCIFAVSDHGDAMRDLLRRPFDLRYADLSRTVLADVDLRGADLRRANLTQADLSRAQLSGADLRYAILVQADLSGANLSKTTLGRANFEKANLNEADLNDAHLQNANLVGVTLIGSKLQNAILSDANLRDAVLSGAKLLDANLVGASLVNAEFRTSPFERAVLEANTTLRNAVLDKADLANAKISQEQLDEACLQDANTPPRNIPISRTPPANTCTDIVGITVRRLFER